MDQPYKCEGPADKSLPFGFPLIHGGKMLSMTMRTRRLRLQCSPANPAQAGEEAVGLSDLSGLPSSFCVLVGE